MATTQNTFTGNGSNLGPFSFTFKWLESTDIKVTVGGVLKTAGTHYNLQSLNYTTKTGGQVLFTAGNAPANGASIRIYRDTDDEALSAVFSSGSAIRAKDLNDNFTQNLYVVQEVSNNAVSIDGSNPMVGDLNMGGYKITNLATPVAGTDAANRSFVEGVFSSEVPVFYRRWSKTAAGGETSLSGNDDNGIALSYIPGSEKVFINGALQVRGVDYSGTTGSTLTGIPALIAGDIVEVHSSSSYTVGTVPDGSITNAKVDGGAAIQSTKLAFTPSGAGATTRTVAAKLADVVSVKDFGAVGDGTTNDSNAFKLACEAAIASGLRLVLPTANYLINTGVLINIPNEKLLEIDGQGSTLTLASTSWEQIQFKNSTASNGCTVRISNLNLKGATPVSTTYWGPASSTYPKNIGLLIESQNIDLFNVTVRDLWGKALNLGYFQDVSINKVKFRNVGGHSYTYTDDAYGNGDAFGDAIYFNRVSGSAYVRINDFDAEAMTTAGPGAAGAGGGLSRAGIVFEFSAAGATGLKVDVENFKCQGFERTFHFEDTVASTLYLRDADVKNTAEMVHTYIATVSAQIENLTYTANPNVAFAVDSFFFQQVTAIIKNSLFYNPTKAWNGNVADVPSGTNLTFENCTLYYNDARQQGKNCTVSFIGCNIFDYNDNASNATMNVSYSDCSFNTTIPATYGNILSASSGSETFYRCNFTNQQPSVAKTIQMALYRDDSGIGSGSCLRINNATTDMPRIRNAIYRVMEIDTGITRLGYVTDTGSIYAPGAVPAIQAGSTSTTVRCGSGVTFSAFVEIVQHPKL